MINPRSHRTGPEVAPVTNHPDHTARSLGEKAVNPNRAFTVIPANAPARISREDMTRYYGPRFQYTEAVALCELSEKGGVAVLRDMTGEGKHSRPTFWVAPYETADGGGSTGRIDVSRRADLRLARSPDDAVSLLTFEPVDNYWTEPKVWLNPSDEGIPYANMTDATIVIDPSPGEHVQSVSSRDAYSI